MSRLLKACLLGGGLAMLFAAVVAALSALIVFGLFLKWNYRT